MWYLEEFDSTSLVQEFLMEDVDDDKLRSLIRIRNTEDWLRGVGHPIEPHQLVRFHEFIHHKLEPNPECTYFACYYQE